MIKQTFLIFSFIALLCGCSENDVKPRPTTPLNITTSNGEIHFNVEIARTPEELKKGLMHRSEIHLTNGMIFDIYPVRPIAMWMKNTKISLDMLFVGPDATITKIKEHATPLSEDLIVSREPVRAVIEIPAGNVMRYNIKVGDKVQHSIFNALTTLSDAPIPPAGAVIPKGPNAPGAAGPVIPKGPNAPGAAGPVIPKGPSAPAQ